MERLSEDNEETLNLLRCNSSLNDKPNDSTNCLPTPPHSQVEALSIAHKPAEVLQKGHCNHSQRRPDRRTAAKHRRRTMGPTQATAEPDPTIVDCCVVVSYMPFVGAPQILVAPATIPLWGYVAAVAILHTLLFFGRLKLSQLPNLEP